MPADGEAAKGCERDYAQVGGFRVLVRGEVADVG